MTLHYSPLDYDHEEKYDDQPRKDILELFPENCKTVLEIGCGAGSTGAVIKEKNPHIYYVGTEIDAEAARMAQSRLDEVIVGDIEKMDSEPFYFKKDFFDLVIAADVLEHLYDPWRLMGVLRGFIKEKGKILLSIPNTQNIQLIANLIQGHWTYQKYGLLDATHIRFFTWSEIEKLLTGTGYRILRSVNNLQANLDEYHWPLTIEIGNLALKEVSREAAEKLFTFQYLILAEKANFSGRS